jgi:hypothetical protein
MVANDQKVVMHVNQYVPHFLRFPEKINTKEFKEGPIDERVDLKAFDQVLTKTLFGDRKKKYYTKYKEIEDFDDYDSDQEK